MRMIVAYQKKAASRFVGHLDMMRMMQRCLRMSELPIQYSRGFHPHVRLSFASPLSVGVIGEHEMMDLPIQEVIDKTAFIQRMNSVLPASLQMVSCCVVEDDFPSLMSLVAGADYRIEVDDCEACAKLPDAISTFMTATECNMLRTTKSGEELCNIRPFVLLADARTENGKLIITYRTKATQKGMLKPSLWFEALCKLAEIEKSECMIYRTSILMQKDDQLVPMEAICE